MCVYTCPCVCVYVIISNHIYVYTYIWMYTPTHPRACCILLKCVAVCTHAIPAQLRAHHGQYAAVCCSVLQFVAMRCSGVQRVSVNRLQKSFTVRARRTCRVLQHMPCVAAIQSVLQYGFKTYLQKCKHTPRAMCCSVLQCCEACCSLLQCFAVFCSIHI